MNRDVGVTELLRTVLPEWSVPVFEITALLGDELVVISALGLIAIVDVFRSVRRGDDRGLSSETATVFAVVLGGLALTLALKTVFGLSRPPSSLQAIPRESGGFPSGHTMAATVLWLSLARWSDWLTARHRLVGASLVIGLVGISRLALGVHYLVDVIASVGFGIGYLLVATKVAGAEPARAFGGATVLGGLALLVTGGTTDGWLALVGCVGATVVWVVVSRPSIQQWRHAPTG